MVAVKWFSFLLLVTCARAAPIADVSQKLDDPFVVVPKQIDSLSVVDVAVPREEVQPVPNLRTPPEKLLEEFMTYHRPNTTAEDNGYKLGYSVEEGSLKRFRYEEKTPDGLIVGEFGFHSRSNGVIRGVRYTAEAGVRPKLLYEALLKFLSL